MTHFRDHIVRYSFGLALLLLLLIHAGGWAELGGINRLDAVIYDSLVNVSSPGFDRRSVAIVDIDEKSLAELGRWPWGRDRLAILIDQLFDRYGAALVGFDMVFPQADDSSGLSTLEQLSDGALRDNQAFQSVMRSLRPQLNLDARFADALKGRPVVLGYYFSSQSGEGDVGALPEPVLPAGTFNSRRVAFAHWSSYGGNMPIFQQNAVAAGHMNPMIDPDGITRRVPLLVEYGNAYYESLSLAMVRAWLGMPKLQPGYPDGGTLNPSRHYGDMEWLDMVTSKGSVRVPVDENAAALIPYAGPQNSIDYYSAVDVLTGSLPVAQLNGRIVLIGTSAPAMMDLRATPVGAAYPGVEMHANLVAGMLSGSLKHRPAYIHAANMLLLLICGGVMIFFFPRLSPLPATLAAIAVLLGIVVLTLLLWFKANLIFPAASGFILIIVLYSANMSWGYFVESKSRRQLVHQFGQYVPPEIVDEMANNPENYNMAGREAELTVMFADIRGFTSISESMSAEQLAAMLNDYLDTMTAIIGQHRGTLDKYMGDAIMAFWGAPVDDERHARHAVTSALEMQRQLQKLNPVLKSKGWPALKIGIGINTGAMKVGDMGSRVRKAYTVVGDSVNLASRLEALTKKYGVDIMVGDRTRELLVKEFAFQEVDWVRVKGKLEPVMIYEPLGPISEIGRERFDELRLWHGVLRAYRERNWEKAELGLLNLSRVADRPLYALYRERIAHYRHNPPDPSWDGIWVFDSK